jgi:four helix bundle protein
VSAFRDLDVYRRAVGLADDVYSVIGPWSAFDRYVLGSQLVRAMDSVGANIAEALGRWSAKDQRRMLYVARGSAYEAEHWLERADIRGLALPTDAIPRAKELSRMLNGLIAKHRAQGLRTEN